MMSARTFYICPKCGGYFRVHAHRRIEMIADEGSFEEWDKEMQVSNPLNFPIREETCGGKKITDSTRRSSPENARSTGKRRLSASAMRDF